MLNLAVQMPMHETNFRFCSFYLEIQIILTHMDVIMLVSKLKKQKTMKIFDFKVKMICEKRELEEAIKLTDLEISMNQ